MVVGISLVSVFSASEAVCPKSVDIGYNETIAGAPFFSPIQTAIAGSECGASGRLDVVPSGSALGFDKNNPLICPSTFRRRAGRGARAGVKTKRSELVGRNKWLSSAVMTGILYD